MFGFRDRRTNGYLMKVKNGSGTRINDLNASKIRRLFTRISENANWNDALIVLGRSTQNAGTASTLYTAGDWSSDNFNLINSPGWRANGLDFQTNQYGVMSNDIWVGGTALTVMADFNQDTVTGAQIIVGIYGTTSPLNQRSWAFDANAGTSYRFFSTATGSLPLTSTFGTPAATTQRSAILIYSANSLTAYINGLSSTVTTNPTASLFNSTTKIMIGSANEGAPGSFFDGPIAAVILFKSTLPAANALAINAAMEGLR